MGGVRNMDSFYNALFIYFIGPLGHLDATATVFCIENSYLHGCIIMPFIRTDLVVVVVVGLFAPLKNMFCYTGNIVFIKAMS